MLLEPGAIGVEGSTEFFRPLTRLFEAFAILVASALGLLAVIAVLTARGLSRPLTRLVGSALRIGGGDLETPVPPERIAEFGVLARELELMRDRLESRTRQLKLMLAGVAFPSDVIGGMDLGNQVGQAVIAYAGADGSGQSFTGSFPAAPGVWSSATPVAPLAGTWRPWVLTAGNQSRPAAPPAFGSGDANTQYTADKNLQRTNATNHLAWFWQPGFFQPWLRQIETEIFQSHQDSNAPRAARAYALETIAQHDASLACWDAKYAYLELRPPQADILCLPFRSIPAILPATPAPLARPRR